MSEIKRIEQLLKSYRDLGRQKNVIQTKQDDIKKELMKIVPSNKTLKIGAVSIYWGYSDTKRFNLCDLRKLLTETQLNNIATKSQSLKFDVLPKPAKK